MQAVVDDYEIYVPIIPRRIYLPVIARRMRMAGVTPGPDLGPGSGESVVVRVKGNVERLSSLLPGVAPMNGEQGLIRGGHCTGLGSFGRFRTRHAGACL